MFGKNVSSPKFFGKTPFGIMTIGKNSDFWILPDFPSCNI
jgi:hypothetical protein